MPRLLPSLRRLPPRGARLGVIAALPQGYDVDTHFSPRYDPWDQRLCMVPDGDLFKSISRGEAEIVTWGDYTLSLNVLIPAVVVPGGTTKEMPSRVGAPSGS